MNNEFLITRIRDIYNDKNYKFFTKGRYNINFGGIRASDPRPKHFDDLFYFIYKDSHDIWRMPIWRGSTDPGIYWLNNPMRREGTAILPPGQHLQMFKWGAHKGQYPAWVQNIPIPVYRDNNKDDILNFDPETIHIGTFGINFHHAGWLNKILKDVGKWSGGCQVMAFLKDWAEMMKISNEYMRRFDPILSYTLLEERDVA